MEKALLELLDAVTAWISAHQERAGLIGLLIWSELEGMSKNPEVNTILQRVKWIIGKLEPKK